MRELVACLLQWLEANREDVRAHSLWRALAAETLKRSDSADPAQREFDAEELAEAVGKAVGFEAAKRWVASSELETFGKARRTAIEQHFRSAGHEQALRIARRSPGGKHRAVWFYEAYELPPEAELMPSAKTTESSGSADSLVVQYDYTPPGLVQPAWYARPLIGPGSFITWSWRGLLWLLVLLMPIAYLAFSAFLVFAYSNVRRPIETGDLASMFLIGVIAWGIWRALLRPFVWLIEDRVANAPALWAKMNEDPAQFELVTAENSRRKLQLVRYTAVCPVCAGQIELRYSLGINQRRLIGCCSESPQEHVFSFDRVLRQGQRLPSAQA